MGITWEGVVPLLPSCFFRPRQLTVDHVFQHRKNDPCHRGEAFCYGGHKEGFWGVRPAGSPTRLQPVQPVEDGGPTGPAQERASPRGVQDRPPPSTLHPNERSAPQMMLVCFPRNPSPWPVFPIAGTTLPSDLLHAGLLTDRESGGCWLAGRVEGAGWLGEWRMLAGWESGGCWLAGRVEDAGWLAGRESRWVLADRESGGCWLADRESRGVLAGRVEDADWLTGRVGGGGG